MALSRSGLTEANVAAALARRAEVSGYPHALLTTRTGALLGCGSHPAPDAPVPSCASLLPLLWCDRHGPRKTLGQRTQ